LTKYFPKNLAKFIPQKKKKKNHIFSKKISQIYTPQEKKNIFFPKSPHNFRLTKAKKKKKITSVDLKFVLKYNIRGVLNYGIAI
jgi:hypothetical protein